MTPPPFTEPVNASQAELSLDQSADPQTNLKVSSRRNFYGFTLNQLRDHLKSFGKEQFRAQQLFKWVYEKRTVDPMLMSNLAKDFREEISELFSFHMPTIKSHLRSIDGTQKFLFELEGGFTVESVIIPSDDRLTLCVSSEVGCNMGCKFCFTGKQKLKRRLKSHEIVGQFMQVQDELAKTQKRITNIVFMGMGEPLDNSDEVFQSIEILHDPFGVHFSRRKVTVSTSGIVPEMHKVAKHGVRLAVSLNASNDAIRDDVMPINKRWPLKELLQACRDYCKETGDRVTFEYVMLKGVTDSVAQARELHQLTKSIPSKLNIIPFNEHPGSDYQRPDDQRIEAFHSELMRLGSHVLLRRTMGRDIFAACGQLTSEIENKPVNMDISNSKIGSIYRRNQIVMNPQN